MIEQVKPAEKTFDTIPTRESLLSRLKDWNDDASWKVFFDTYWRLIYNAATRAGLNDAEAQDVVQETVLSVLKAMPKFKYEPERGSFKSWLWQVTKRRIADLQRKRLPGRSFADAAERSSGREDLSATVERMADPNGSGFERIWDEEWETNLKQAALDRIKRQVDLKQYQIFDLYVIRGWEVSDIVRTLKVNRGLVYLTKHRVQRLLRQEIARLLAKPI